MKPAISFWERTGNALRVLRGMVINGSTEVQAQPIRERLGDMLKTMQQHTPDGGLKEVEEAKLCITTGVDKLDGEHLHRAVRVVNDILRLALKADANFPNQAYQNFVVEACSGGASAGHATVRAFEKDSGTSYEDQISTMQMEQGITVEARVHSRAYLWGSRSGDPTSWSLARSLSTCRPSSRRQWTMQISFPSIRCGTSDLASAAGQRRLA